MGPQERTAAVHHKADAAILEARRQGFAAVGAVDGGGVERAAPDGDGAVYGAEIHRPGTERHPQIARITCRTVAESIVQRFGEGGGEHGVVVDATVLGRTRLKDEGAHFRRVDHCRKCVLEPVRVFGDGIHQVAHVLAHMGAHVGVSEFVLGRDEGKARDNACGQQGKGERCTHGKAHSAHDRTIKGAERACHIVRDGGERFAGVMVGMGNARPINSDQLNAMFAKPFDAETKAPAHPRAMQKHHHRRVLSAPSGNAQTAPS